MNLFLYLLTVLIWGTTWIALKWQLGVVAIPVSIVYRFGLAALVLFVMLLLSRKLQVMNRRGHLICLAQGLCLFCVNFMCFLTASQWIPSGLVAVVFSTAKDLNATQITLLPKVTLQMTVTCDAPVIFALKATDNRIGSGSGSGFGLGFINGTQKLGSYSLTLGATGSPPQADGETVQAIGSFDNGVTWERWNSFETGTYLSVATLADASTPRATQQLVTPVAYSGYINRTDGLDLSNEVNIDGSATIEVLYL